MISINRPSDIHHKLVEFCDEGRSFALALILKAEGHTPQKAGVKALIEASGKIRGTLGGGRGEAEAQRLARAACQSGRAVVFDFKMTNAYARDAGPICGGLMRILIDPNVAHYRLSYERAAEALAQRRRGVLVTRVRTDGSQVDAAAQWFAQESVPTDPGFPGAEAVCECLASGTAQLHVEHARRPGASSEVIVEPLIPPPLLLIVGGGHVGQALARLAVWNGFDVTVIDDRPEFTDPALFGEGVRTQCGDIPREIAGFPIDRETCVVIVTRGHKQDAEALEACIQSPAAYLGMIGSRRKVAMVRSHFLESGLATEEVFDHVFAPIGLDIGAITVPEIATSIMAQIIAVRRKGAACFRVGNKVTP